MARKNNTDELIHCNVCGEDYSPTYRRCPFCGERADLNNPVDDDDFDDGYVFDGQALFDDEPADDQAAVNKGGKRLASGSSSKSAKSGGAPMKKSKGSHYDPPSAINWMRLITYGISLVIIIAALIIVFTVVYPKIHDPDTPTDPNPPGTSSVDPEDPSDPVTDPPEDPSDPVTDPPEDPTDPVEPGVAAYISGAAGGLNVRSGPGTSYDVQDSLVNGDEVTILEVAEGGWYKISYSGKNGQATTGYVKSDYVTASGDTPSNDPPPSTDPTPSTSSGELVPGAKGQITGAASGLRVRSGPGTTYDILASLMNGNDITILEDAGNGWYKIAYSGSDGKETTGYIMGDYIAVN